MFEHITIDVILLIMLYTAGATTAALASVYLGLRRSNAFAPGISTPLRLRRWTAAFFAFLAVSHFWYIPAALATSEEDIMMGTMIGALLDCMTIYPLAIVILLCMLQDRSRPLWPVAVLVAPLVIIVVASIATRSYALKPVLFGYMLLLAVGLTIYMVCAVRQYGRWLRDNYADLENKEVWQSFVVYAAILLVFVVYSSGYEGMVYEYIVQVCGILLTCFLLWRVETLSSLTPNPSPKGEGNMKSEGNNHSSPIEAEGKDDSDIGVLLQRHCVVTKLYLQHDLTVQQLAQAIDTNRSYLSQYFSARNTTYNAYINTLRINHFIELYRAAVAAHMPIKAKQLAKESGYRSYSTFSLAFKQRMGQSVTAWMCER